MNVQPYLSFEGRCEEAIEFYKKALGAEVLQMMRFKDHPAPQPPGMIQPGTEQKVMHASLRVGEATLMASDGRCMGQTNFHGISLSLTAANDSEAQRLFKALSDGGKVSMPLAKTFFSSNFGMVNDRFGVPWMIWVAPE
jgi:PhnB protein